MSPKNEIKKLWRKVLKIENNHFERIQSILKLIGMK